MYFKTKPFSSDPDTRRAAAGALNHHLDAAVGIGEENHFRATRAGGNDFADDT
jgi:hypothetical protein